MAARISHQMIMLVMVITAAALWGVAQSQSDCNNALMSMSPCLDYITGNASTPSSSCCSQFASVIKSQPQCLCQVLNGGSSSLGLNVNQTQALALPGACRVQTPSVNSCNASPSGPASGTNPSSGNGYKTNPSSESSNGYNIKLPSSMLLPIQLTASFTFIFAAV